MSKNLELELEFGEAQNPYLIALSTCHKAYARDSKFSMLFLNKAYARKQRQAVKATL
jgi:hypothetical protein